MENQVSTKIQTFLKEWNEELAKEGDWWEKKWNEETKQLDDKI